MAQRTAVAHGRQRQRGGGAPSGSDGAGGGAPRRQRQSGGGAPTTATDGGRCTERQRQNRRVHTGRWRRGGDAARRWRSEQAGGADGERARRVDSLRDFFGAIRGVGGGECSSGGRSFRDCLRRDERQRRQRRVGAEDARRRESADVAALDDAVPESGGVKPAASSCIGVGRRWRQIGGRGVRVFRGVGTRKRLRGSLGVATRLVRDDQYLRRLVLGSRGELATNHLGHRECSVAGADVEAAERRLFAST